MALLQLYQVVGRHRLRQVFSSKIAVNSSPLAVVVSPGPPRVVAACHAKCLLL